MTLLDLRVLYLLIILLIVASISGIVAANRAFEERRRSIQLLEILVGIVEAGNPNLNGHSMHVHNLCMLLYEFLPYSYKFRVSERDLHYASLLLDIGKLAISPEIMERAGRLDSSEWEMVKKHPEMGVDILRDVTGFTGVREFILYHHERIDGKGYHGLKGEQIPLGARIISIADTYSALTMDRSYRATLPYAEAVSELEHSAGTQLDRELVKIFCSIPMKKVDGCLEDVRRKLERFSEGGN